MTATYIASSNVDDNGTALGADNEDVRVFKLLIGLPTDGSKIRLYNQINPVGDATTNIAFQLTQPTAAAGKNWVREVDFGPNGLPLTEGGNIVIDGTNNVTVIWALAGAESGRY